MHDEKYSLPALAAAVVKHAAPGGAAYLMSTKGRPGVAALPAALQHAHAAAAGGEAGALDVACEDMAVMSSFGAAEVVLVTARFPPE